MFYSQKKKINTNIILTKSPFWPLKKQIFVLTKEKFIVLCNHFKCIVNSMHSDDAGTFLPFSFMMKESLEYDLSPDSMVK